MCYAEPQDLTDIVREAIKERPAIKEPDSKATEEVADGGGNGGAGVEGGSDPAEKKERSSN